MKNSFKVIIIIIVLAALGYFGYAKFYHPTRNEQNGVAPQYLQTNNIKILYPLIGTKIESGSKLEVKYEVLNDITSNPNFSAVTPQVVILINDKCGDSFQSKPKGVYTFSCTDIGAKQIGPLSMTIIEVARSAQEQPIIAMGKIEIVAPVGSNVKPLEIITESLLEVYVPVGSESDENVAASSLNPQIRFSDGVTRDVPFTDFTYSFDDPTLVRFYSTGAKVPVFIGNRVGKTILHLQYQGIKKDISIRTVPDATTLEDPSTYEKVYNTSPTSLNDFRAMCKQKNGTLQEDPNGLHCTSTSGNYFITVRGF